MPGATLTPAARRWRWLLWLLGAVITVLALTPAPEEQVGLGWDKLNHAAAFAALGWCAALGYRGTRGQTLAALAGVLAFGAAIELLQLSVPNRSAEWADLAADAIGMAIGALLARVWLQRGATRATAPR